MNTKTSQMSKLSLIVLFLILLLGCNSTNKKGAKPAIAKEKTNQKIIKKQSPKKTTKKKVIKLNDNNVKKKLTKYGNENKEALVLLKTPKGNMKIKLYKNTPLHRANFIRLIKNNFYKETMFYRVVNDFMIQGGDNDDWERQSIKIRMGDYTIPAEFREANIHKKGALSMAREYENNPAKRSVSFEFFIVQGTKYTEGELLGAEQQYDLKISAEHKEIYKAIGGTPHLDGNHTVFGQVIEGFDVIDAIAAVKVDEGDWPIEDITLDFQIIE